MLPSLLDPRKSRFGSGGGDSTPVTVLKFNNSTSPSNENVQMVNLKQNQLRGAETLERQLRSKIKNSTRQSDNFDQLNFTTPPIMLDSFESTQNKRKQQQIDYQQFKHHGNNQANLNIKKALGEITKKRKEISEIQSSRTQIQSIIAQNKVVPSYDSIQNQTIQGYSNVFDDEQFLNGKIKVKQELLPNLRQSQDRSPLSNQQTINLLNNSSQNLTSTSQHKKQLKKPINQLRNSMDQHKHVQGYWNQQKSTLMSPNVFKKEVDQVIRDETLLNGYKDVSANNTLFLKERFSIYQQDFEVKVNKMNIHLDSELKHLSKSVNGGLNASMIQNGNQSIRNAQEITNAFKIDQQNSNSKQQSQKMSAHLIQRKKSIIDRKMQLKESSSILQKFQFNQQRGDSPIRVQNLDESPALMAELTFGHLSKQSLNLVINEYNMSNDDGRSSFNTEMELANDRIHSSFDEEIDDGTQSVTKSVVRQLSSPKNRHHQTNKNMIRVIKDFEFEIKIRNMIQEFQIQKDYTTFENNMSRRSLSPQFEILHRAESLDKDPNLKYFLTCNKENVLALPALSKIQNKQLVLQGYPLNRGLARAIKQYLKYFTNCITKLALDNNSLLDTWLFSILKGVNYQDDFKQLILCRNAIGQQSTTILCQILRKQFPKHLEDLKITNCKITSSFTFQILQSIREGSYLRKLSLVKATLSDQNISVLSGIISTSRHLVDLDISWNGLRSSQMKEFWLAIGKNRVLQFLNLSWNNLTNSSEQSQDITALMKDSLIRFIKYNSNALHLDLSFTQLNEEFLRDLGSSLRKAKSLLAIHLSGNPGITEELKSFLLQRIHAKENRNYNFAIESSIANQQSHYSPRAEQVIDGVLMQQITQRKYILDSTNFQKIKPALENQKLIFQRYLSHKYEMPGSGQWQMLTHQDNYDSPNCSECWVCSKYIYSVIFWSKSIEYSMSEEYEEAELTKLISLSSQKENQSSKTDKPQILGSFNNWEATEMIPLHEFCFYLDPAKNDAFKTLKKIGKIQEDVNDFGQLNQSEQKQFLKIQNEINSDYKMHWKDIITKNLKYKKAQYINNQLLENVDLQNEDIYVCATFMRPGRHVYVIQDNQNSHLLKCITNLREEEIPIFVKSNKQKVQQRVFKKDTSVFKEWKEDVPYTISQMLEDDIKQWKCHRFIKDDNDVITCIKQLFTQRLACEKIIRQNVVILKKIFTTEICNSGFPNISWIDFSNFCDKCKIVDKNVVLATIDRIFIATNVEIEKNSDNPDKALQRFEFYEILVRLAQSKFKDPGICPTYAESLQKLLNEHIFPHAHPDPWQEFRDEQLWTMDVNDVLEANLEGLKKVYSYYWEPRKKFMTQVDAMNLMLRDSALNLIDKDGKIVIIKILILANYCYGMCKMSVILESVDTWQYKQLKFVELLELVGRIADLKFKGTDNEALPLAKKIEFILDILLRMVEFQRKDVNIQVLEESESDDEY